MENTIGFYDSGVGGLNILKKTITNKRFEFCLCYDNFTCPMVKKQFHFE